MRLTFLARHATRIMALGVFLGVLVPPLAAAARPFLTATLFCVLTLSLLRTDVVAIRAWARRPLALFLILTWLLVVCPILAAAVLAPLPVSDRTRTAFVLFAAAPPITAIPAYAILMNLRPALATVVLTIASFAAPIVLPIIALAILGLSIDISAVAFFGRLALLIGGSFVLAAGLRRLIGISTIQAHAMPINGLIVVAMLILALAIMGGITAQLLADPWHVMAFAIAVVIANVCLQAATTAMFWRLGRADALTVGLNSGYRNSILLLAVIGGSASPELALMAATAQISVYVLPALQRPIVDRLLGNSP